jgi:uncharacterized protein (DUF2237 family)
MTTSRNNARNVLGTPLEICGTDPVTGFYRNGCCDTGPDDTGMHTVCAIMTEEFLRFSKQRGNDLITPRPPGFAGLHAGDPWCLCAMRWLEAYQFGVAPPVLLSATHESTLTVIPREALEMHALDRHVDA